MAREFAKRFYRSAAWRRCRASFIAEREAVDGGLCEYCRQEPGEIVHHTVWLTPKNIGEPAVALNHSLLRYVCWRCHNRIEEGGRFVMFDEAGQPIMIDEATEAR